MNHEKDFKFILPIELSKSDDGEWRVRGLASTASRDAQGEVILQDGMDLSPIDQGKGVLNWDHQNGPENTVGVLDGYKKSPYGLVVEGRLFKNHTRAKAIHEIMSSLGKSDKGRIGMSVQGKILERAGESGKIIKKCRINAVALTLNPVNSDTYADLVKSLSAGEFEWDSTDLKPEFKSEIKEEPVFTISQVMGLLEKALTAGEPSSKIPSERTNGEVLAKEELEQQPRKIDIDEDWEPKKKKLKKMCKPMYKSSMEQVLDNIQILYPNVPKEILWGALKNRLEKKFPEITDLD